MPADDLEVRTGIWHGIGEDPMVCQMASRVVQRMCYCKASLLHAFMVHQYQVVLGNA
jgi:hypothetical protein